MPFTLLRSLPARALALLVIAFFAHAAVAQHTIIPAPVSFRLTSGAFTLDGRTTLVAADARAQPVATFFANTLKVNGKALPVEKTAKDKAVVFALNATPDPALGSEGYTLTVGPTRVEMTANQSAGLFYAVQTFRQLLPAAAFAPGADLGRFPVLDCQVTDAPRFGWRGLMLDVSRSWFTKDEVKQYIDLMAQYKFNVFHWHLTDDNGWRIEIKSLPKLTQVGAWRVARTGHFGDRAVPLPGEPTPYGGFYTQDDIREVVQYATARHITIVPEIDVPGHSMAALAAYPELSTRKEPKQVNPGTKFSEWYGNGKFKMLIENTLNPSDEKVYAFLDQVFTEVAALFPARYIHMGGDECYHGYWEEDAGCRAFMTANKLKDTHELQSYFVKRVEKIIQSKGKTMLGWDEILEGGLAPNATVMSWRGMAGGTEAARQRHDVVMSPTTFAYLDYTQGDPTVETPIYAALSLRKAYTFDPLPEGVEAKYILGGQGNLWTEQIPTLRHATYMAYPRAWATAESVWSKPAAKNWEDFMRRTEVNFARADAAGIKVAKAVYDPIVTARLEGDQLTADITCDAPGAEIYYTLDGTFPDQFSSRYTAPIVVPAGNVRLQTITYRNAQPLGRLLQIPRPELEKRAKK